jgi:hypothetical protein
LGKFIAAAATMPPIKESCILLLRAGCKIGNENAYRAFIRGLDDSCIRVISEISLNLLYNTSITLPPSIRQTFGVYRQNALALIQRGRSSKSRRRHLIRAGVEFLRKVLSAYTKVFVQNRSSSKTKAQNTTRKL